jgi:acetyl-CoA carboxylase biotin carboxyl carrier protein
MAIVDLRTEITGVVREVVAAKGERVAEDATIVMLESMKMAIPVSAPEAGVVAEILVTEEQIVTEGSVVARLEV